MPHPPACRAQPAAPGPAAPPHAAALCWLIAAGIIGINATTAFDTLAPFMTAGRAWWLQSGGSAEQQGGRQGGLGAAWRVAGQHGGQQKSSREGSQRSRAVQGLPPGLCRHGAGPGAIERGQALEREPAAAHLHACGVVAKPCRTPQPRHAHVPSLPASAQQCSGQGWPFTSASSSTLSSPRKVPSSWPPPSPATSPASPCATAAAAAAPAWRRPAPPGAR